MTKTFTNNLQKIPRSPGSEMLRLLWTFAGVLPCPPEKKIMHAILKESTANCISLESLINVDFRKKYELPVF